MIERKKILIIDDSEAWFKVLDLALKNYHDVHWALGVLQATRLLRVIKYDFIISDYMGITLDGKPPDFSFLDGENFIVSSGEVLQKKRDNFVAKDDILDWFKKNNFTKG